MNRAVFFDRDGTLNVDFGYVHQPEHLVLENTALGALHEIQQLGYLLFIVTNQSGIGRGYYTKADFDVCMRAFEELFLRAGIRFQGVFLCPHHPRDSCGCRKPKTGMLDAAIQEHSIDTQKSFFIGDKEDDIAAGKAVGATTVLIDPSGSAARADLIHQPHFRARTLYEASLWIQRQHQNRQ